MALEAASGAAGLISLGLTVCDGLLKYYNSWKDAETDARRMYGSIETLKQTFAALKDTLEEPCLDKDLVHRVEQSIERCKGGINNLGKKLEKINMTADQQSGKRNTKISSKLQRALYPFKESTLAKLKEISNELLENLQLNLGILHL